LKESGLQGKTTDADFRLHFLFSENHQENATMRKRHLSHWLQWGKSPKLNQGEFYMHPEIAVFVFLSIGAICLFAIFLPITTWITSRQKEREAYYKSETIRRIAESSGEGSKAAMDMLREEERLKRIKAREGIKVGGLVNIGVGIGLGVFLWTIGGHEGSPFMVGLIPLLIGVALLVYIYFLASPIEDGPKN
jgi:hypothetical protein